MAGYSRENKSKTYLDRALSSYYSPFSEKDDTLVDGSGVENPNGEKGKSLVNVEKTNEVGFPYLNEAKTMEIYLGYSSTERLNWRNIFQRDNDKYWVVSPNVKLFPNSKNIELSSEIEVDFPVEAYIKKFGDNGHIKKLTEAIFSFGSYGNNIGNTKNATVVLENTRIPSYKTAKNATVPSSLKFDFYFGQAGLFDAFEEVVKPVLVLAKMPMPSSAGGLSFSYLPNTANLQLRLALNFMKTVEGTVKSQLREKSEKEMQERMSQASYVNDLTKKDGTQKEQKKTKKLSLFEGTRKKVQDGQNLAVAVTSGIVNMVQTTINSTSKEMGSFVITYGSLVYPPVYITKSKINFNMEQVDELGYPTSGSVELSGISTISNSSRQLIDKMLQKKEEAIKGQSYTSDKIEVNTRGSGI